MDLDSAPVSAKYHMNSMQKCPLVSKWRKTRGGGIFAKTPTNLARWRKTRGAFLHGIHVSPPADGNIQSCTSIYLQIYASTFCKIFEISRKQIYASTFLKSIGFSDLRAPLGASEKKLSSFCFSETFSNHRNRF